MFSQRFKELRKERKLSQAKVAEDLDMSQATIASWEAGSRMPLSDMVPQIADYFQVSIDYLFGTKKPTKQPISDDDIRFALSGGEKPITQAQYDEVKQFVRFIKERDNADS